MAVGLRHDAVDIQDLVAVTDAQPPVVAYFELQVEFEIFLPVGTDAALKCGFLVFEIAGGHIRCDRRLLADIDACPAGRYKQHGQAQCGEVTSNGPENH